MAPLLGQERLLRHGQRLRGRDSAIRLRRVEVRVMHEATVRVEVRGRRQGRG